MVRNADEAQQFARASPVEFELHQRLRYDETRRSLHYNTSDLVWIWTPIRQIGRPSKLIPRYKGFYKVVDRLSAVNYGVTPTAPPAGRRTPTEDTVHGANKARMFFSGFKSVQIITGIFGSWFMLSREGDDVTRHFRMCGSRSRNGRIVVSGLGPVRDSRPAKYRINPSALLN